MEKECLNIPPLLMIDDAIAISECGPDSVKVNALIQSKVDKYLGDILTSDCKINSNIEERVNKGMGIANQIITLLKEIFLVNTILRWL